MGKADMSFSKNISKSRGPHHTVQKQGFEFPHLRVFRRCVSLELSEVVGLI
jgi:hypothetical protein